MMGRFRAFGLAAAGVPVLEKTSREMARATGQSDGAMSGFALQTGTKIPVPGETSSDMLPRSSGLSAPWPSDVRRPVRLARACWSQRVTESESWS